MAELIGVSGSVPKPVIEIADFELPDGDEWILESGSSVTFNNFVVKGIWTDDGDGTVIRDTFTVASSGSCNTSPNTTEVRGNIINDGSVTCPGTITVAGTTISGDGELSGEGTIKAEQY